MTTNNPFLINRYIVPTFFCTRPSFAAKFLYLLAVAMLVTTFFTHAQENETAVDIKTLLQEDQYTMLELTLDAGSESERSHEFPVFAIVSKKALSMGNFYLISDSVYNGAHIHSLLNLAENMSELGWNAVVIPAPQFMMLRMDTKDSGEDKHEKTTGNTDTNADAITDPVQDSSQTNSEVNIANAETTLNDLATTSINSRHHQSQYDQSYQKAFNNYLKQYVKAAMEASAKTGYQVLYAQGLSAQGLINMDDAELGADAIIVSNLYWPERDINRSLAKALAKTRSPVLDLVSKQDNFWALSTAQQRKTQAQVEIKSHYRQRQLESYSISPEIAKEIYGWLTYLGW